MAALLDTNVLVYAYDPRSAAKQQVAIALIDVLVTSRQAVLSVQCLSEFFVVATSRLPDPLSPHDALDSAEHLAQACRVVELTTAVVLEGLRGSVRHHLSPWDALIWAAAKLNQIPYVLTEDAEHGRILEGVRYLDPFSPAFDAKLLTSPAPE